MHQEITSTVAANHIGAPETGYQFRNGANPIQSYLPTNPLEQGSIINKECKFMKQTILAVVLCILSANLQAQTGIPDYAWYGDGTAAVFYIGTADGLAGLANLVNGLGMMADSFKDKTIQLTDNIDLSVYGKGTTFNSGFGWYPIGIFSSAFQGNFDGCGKVITGLSIDNRIIEPAGLFGVVYNGGTVQNLGVVNVDIQGRRYVGGIAGGVLDGSVITGCFVTGSVGSDFVVKTDNIYAVNTQIGGIAGQITRNSSVNNCYFNGSVSGLSLIGGIVGFMAISCNVTNCYSTGKVTASHPNYNPAYGSFATAGGIVGGIEYYELSTISYCYSTAEIFSIALGTGGIVGSSTGSVNNCAALNPSVTGRKDWSWLGRVAGNCNNLFGNIAFDGMKIDNQENENYHFGKDGESKTAAELHTVSAFHVAFTQTPWTYMEGMLPGLFGAPVEMSAHLILYMVTVTGGTASGGSFTAGETVSIEAQVPAGRKFKNWTTTSPGVTFANSAGSSTSFVMPANDAAITANFETVYTVTVTGGTANGDSFTAGETVSIEAQVPAGQKFKNWTTTSLGVTFANSAGSSTTFVMPANDVTITANFEILTGSPELASANPLRAWRRNGALHVTGITAGEMLSIYNTAGALVYQGIATSNEADIPLKTQGVYIIQSGNNTIKVTFHF